MKRLKKLIPAVLAVIIICFGFFSIYLMSYVLPEYKYSVIEHEKIDKDNILFASKTDELQIYPFNLFNLSSCEYIDSLEKIFWDLHLIYNAFYMLDESYFPDGQPVFPAWHDKEHAIYFITDYKYVTFSGEQCYLNAALTEKNVLYFHCSYYKSKELLPDEAEGANKSITELLNQYISSEKYSDEMLKQNPFYTFFVDYYNKDYEYDVNEERFLIPHIYKNKDITFTTVSCGSEVVIILNNNSDFNVLFFNPEDGVISGFTFKDD